MISKTHCTILFSLFLGMTPMSLAVWAQGNEVKLAEKRVTLKVENVPIGTVFAILLDKFDIPIGFEESILDRNNPDFRFDVNPPRYSRLRLIEVGGVLKGIIDPRSNIRLLHPLTLNIENERLSTALDAIIEELKNYEWKIRDGVVNIYPKDGRDERFKRLLGLRIKGFDFRNGQTVGEILKIIRDLPEFSNFMTENNLICTGSRSGPEVLRDEQSGRRINADLKLRKISLMKVLNQMAKLKRGGWVLSWRFKSKTNGVESIELSI